MSPPSVSLLQQFVQRMVHGPQEPIVGHSVARGFRDKNGTDCVLLTHDRGPQGWASTFYLSGDGRNFFRQFPAHPFKSVVQRDSYGDIIEGELCTEPAFGVGSLSFCFYLKLLSGLLTCEDFLGTVAQVKLYHLMPIFGCREEDAFSMIQGGLFFGLPQIVPLSHVVLSGGVRVVIDEGRGVQGQKSKRMTIWNGSELYPRVSTVVTSDVQSVGIHRIETADAIFVVEPNQHATLECPGINRKKVIVTNWGHSDQLDSR